MKSVTLEELIDFAKSKSGESIKTVAGRAEFKVEVLEEEEKFQFSISSGKNPRESFSTVQKVIKLYNELKSQDNRDSSEALKTTPYQDDTFLASYLLGLLKAMSEND